MNQKELTEILEQHKIWLSDQTKGKRADLRSADLSSANLSSAKSIKPAIDCLSEMFKKNKMGFIVYKTFGAYKLPNPNWTIRARSIISENVNFNRTEDCGCGVNFGTKKWVKENNKNQELQVWQCLIKWEWLSGVVVPYATDGEARCERLQLIKRVTL